MVVVVISHEDANDHRSLDTFYSISSVQLPRLVARQTAAAPQRACRRHGGKQPAVSHTPDD